MLQSATSQAPRSKSGAAQERIRSYIAGRHPDEAKRLTDFMVATMARLSAQARDGLGIDRLTAIARLAASASAIALSD